MKCLYAENFISFRTDRPLSSFDSSKVYEHAFDSNHPISEDLFKILSNSTVFGLKVLESYPGILTYHGKLR